MNVQEWALIAFTILVQMSVGAMWVLRVAHYFAARKYGVEEADRLSDRALLALVPVIALAFVASLFHLGNPFNAYRAVTNLGSSWLSREILFGVIFAVLVTVFAFMQWRKIGSFGLRNVIAWLAALVGLVLVFSMSNVYLLQSQPAWNSWATPVSFFATTFLLGALAMGAAFVANYDYVRRKEPDCADVQCTLMREALRWVAVAAVLLVGVELVVLPIYLATLASGSAAGLASVQLMAGSFGWVLALRVILAFVGAGVFAMFLYQNAMSVGREKVLGSIAYPAFVIVLVAEVLARVLFYTAHVRIGI
ncbi:MAG: dimethyl sulfoxide reductase anchor subunit [Chloroflexi bacterium]|nr:dimethyl sulfoxide reductase anchor subunit [Chloroflexota bacterium]